MNSESNQIYTRRPCQRLNIHSAQSVQWMLTLQPLPSLSLKGKTYYFCSDDDKKIFDAAPDKFADAGKKV